MTCHILHHMTPFASQVEMFSRSYVSIVLSVLQTVLQTILVTYFANLFGQQSKTKGLAVHKHWRTPLVVLEVAVVLLRFCQMKGDGLYGFYEHIQLSLYCTIPSYFTYFFRYYLTMAYSAIKEGLHQIICQHSGILYNNFGNKKQKRRLNI
jgi:hypothetical protein